MTQDLVLYDGLDFSKYQLGDKIIISEMVMLTKFRGKDAHRYFYCRLKEIADRLHLWLYLEYDPCTAEYEIQFLDFEPPDFTVDHDAEVGCARRDTDMHPKAHVNKDGVTYDGKQGD
jgi:hypothetical protein